MVGRWPHDSWAPMFETGRIVQFDTIYPPSQFPECDIEWAKLPRKKLWTDGEGVAA